MKNYAFKSASHKRTESTFCEWLANDRANLRKGERTRKELMVTCAKMLETEPYDRLKVSTLCDEAAVSHGTFYVYFDKLNTILAEVLALFVDYVQLQMRSAARQEGNPVHNTTAAYYALFESNSGLMKCLIMGIDAFPEAKTTFQRLNNEWAKTVVRAYVKGRVSSSIAEDELMRRAYALGGMVDQYLTALFVTKDPWICSISQSSDAVITTLTNIWTKGMLE